MFFAPSRYLALTPYSVAGPGGTQVVVTPIPPNRTTQVIGYHPSTTPARLDLLAFRYLGDPTLFWQICDANNSIVPASLAAHDLIGIPTTST